MVIHVCVIHILLLCSLPRQMRRRVGSKSKDARVIPVLHARGFYIGMTLMVKCGGSKDHLCLQRRDCLLLRVPSLTVHPSFLKTH